VNNLIIQTNGGLASLTEATNQINGTVSASVGSAALSITNNGSLNLGNTTAGAVTLNTSLANGEIVATNRETLVYQPLGTA
jgi:hypothetical protein